MSYKFHDGCSAQQPAGRDRVDGGVVLGGLAASPLLSRSGGMAPPPAPYTLPRSIQHVGRARGGRGFQSSTSTKTTQSLGCGLPH